MIKLFLTVLILAVLVFLSENPEKEDCRDTWAKVYGPNARDGASWNSEWNGDVTEETCGFYFDEFDLKARQTSSFRSGGEDVKSLRNEATA